MSIVFFGSPEFAVPSLEALVAAGRTPELVVSQPARPAGRGRRLRQPAVARAAREAGIEVWQPERLRDPEAVRRLQATQADYLIVVAYGQILDEAVLAVPTVAPINVHASLLPRYRGAAPIQAAIAAGDPTTGVSTQRMVRRLDAGPVYLRSEIEIGQHETAGELTNRLARLGAACLVETLTTIETEGLEPRPQDEDSATYAPKLEREDGRLRWERGAREIYDRWRAFTPWPGTHTEFGGTTIKLPGLGPPVDLDEAAPPGTVVEATEAGIVTACGDGGVVVTRLQRPGRPPVDALEALAGGFFTIGDRFGVSGH